MYSALLSATLLDSRNEEHVDIVRQGYLPNTKHTFSNIAHVSTCDISNE